MKNTLLILSFLFMASATTQAQVNEIFKTLFLSTSIQMEKSWENPPVDIKIYPNPATHYITFTNIEGVSRIDIYNLVGKRTKSIDNLIEGDSYDVSDLANGLYLVRVIDENGDVIITKRLSKR